MTYCWLYDMVTYTQPGCPSVEDQFHLWNTCKQQQAQTETLLS